MSNTTKAVGQNRISSLYSALQCYVLFDDKDCSGRKLFLVPPTMGTYLAQNGFDNVIKSIKVCDLTFETPCNQSSCPVFLWYLWGQYSQEYYFWAPFFATASRSKQIELQKRVKQSTDDFISWDFWFTSNKTIPAQTRQYEDVFEALQKLLAALWKNRVGMLGFHTEGIETLKALGLNVLKEREDQLSKFKFDDKDPKLQQDAAY